MKAPLPSPMRLLPALTVLVLACALAAAVSWGPAPAQSGEDATRYHSRFLDDDILVLPDVYRPTTAEHRVLPFLKANREQFEGATVLDIGTGSGIIALYAARLGAAKVVATDISEAAIECAGRNAEEFGYSEIIEPRLVPPSDMSAYSVIRPGERFDVIVSNPPYFLDFDAPANTDETDTGDLGFSIIRGLDEHLAPDGEVILLYGSTFYHQIIVKFARHLEYDVVNYDPEILYSAEVLTLCNSYLRRILAREGLEPDALRFGKGDITALVPRASNLQEDESRPSPYYRGIIVIRNADRDGLQPPGTPGDPD